VSAAGNVVLMPHLQQTLLASLQEATQGLTATDYVVVNLGCTMALRTDDTGAVRFTPAHGNFRGALCFGRLAMAGELAWRWNHRLTAQQRQDGCEVVAMSRAEAARRLVDHLGALVKALEAPDAPPVAQLI
jgi:hypothetical protein